MKLNELIADIQDLRKLAHKLSNDAYKLYCENTNPHTHSVADYLHYELTSISCRLQDLAETEPSEDFTPTETDSVDEAEEISDWWCDLDLQDKCELANVPYPTCNYGRGDEYQDAEERCDKWWYSRTYEQKKEIHTDYEDL